jgi:hypothetical protein
VPFVAPVAAAAGAIVGAAQIPMITSPSSAAIFTTVEMFCTIAPRRTPRALIAATAAIIAAAVACARLSGVAPSSAAPSAPNSRHRYSALVIATAPYAEGRRISNSAQPSRNAGKRPNASRIYT